MPIFLINKKLNVLFFAFFKKYRKKCNFQKFSKSCHFLLNQSFELNYFELKCNF